MDKKNIIIKDNRALELIEEISGKCVECGICANSCMLLKNSCNSPKKYFEKVLQQGIQDTLVPYSCSTCDLCRKVCPKNLNIKDAFKAIRQAIVISNNGNSQIKGHRAVHFHQKLSHCNLFKYSPREKCRVLFLPGCSLSAYSPQLVEKTFDYLKTKIPGIKIMLSCCGNPTEAIGEKEKFEKYYKDFEADILKSEADVVITACQSCYTTISNNSKTIQVKSLWTVLKEIGIPEYSKNLFNKNKEVFTVHDSCATREVTEIHTAVRYIINELGISLTEMKFSGEKTKCCGMGGMACAANPKLSKEMTRDLVKDELASVITYCASCREAIAGASRKSFHILELIFSAEPDSLISKHIQPKSPLKNWSNRLKVKSKIINVMEE